MSQEKQDLSPTLERGIGVLGQETLGIAIVLCVFIALVISTCGGWASIRELSISALPNWLQGIGTVLAIFTAIWVGRQQADANRVLQRDLADANVAQALGAISALFDIALDEFQKAAEEIAKEPHVWFDTIYQDNFYEALNRQIDQISVHGLPTYESVITTIQIKDIVHCASWNLARAYKKRRDPEFDMRLIYLADNVLSLKKECDTFARDLNVRGIFVKPLV